MRKVTLSCVLALGLFGSAAALGVGCGGGDDDQGGDTPDAATDAVGDTGKHDTGVDSGKPGTDSGHDTGIDSGDDDDASVDSGVDTGVDAGTDSAVDAGSDTGVDAGHDSGTDAGTDSGVDAGTDSGTDSGVDAGPIDSGIDSTVDADVDADVDAGLDAGFDAADSETIYSFTNPLQIDVSSVLDVNTIADVTLLDAGVLTPVDGSGYDLLTAAKGLLLGACKGLPDTAFFAANTTIHPGVQLHWSALSSSSNSHIAMPTTSFSFPIPAARYTQFQIYGLSTEGASKLTVTITYADATTNGGKTATFNDWFQSPAGGQFVLASGFGRIGSGGNCDSNGSITISGVNVIPDPSKIVTQITVLNTGTGRFVFFGADAF